MWACKVTYPHTIFYIILTPYFIQVLDAWGKPRTRFFTEILNWVGDYQECVAIRSTYGENDDPGMMLYQGRYCSGIHPSMGAND
ncbi:hypothetical protein EB796_008981 [Bugula neritina]|uniref:Nose resistant-to-fluoxetine protein N-terminal domain-containing protein n=1 Tax=Bugula neritina TaxID=10212 RepID=A0A7J7K244_BUGNE|nr:hypothetical protein EB796_008981 [Bugula neritina]